MFSYHLTLRNYHMFENEKLPPLAYYIYIYIHMQQPGWERAGGVGNKHKYK